jgi:hypothetical protein
VYHYFANKKSSARRSYLVLDEFSVCVRNAVIGNIAFHPHVKIIFFP